MSAESVFIHFHEGAEVYELVRVSLGLGLFILQLARRRCRATRMCEHYPACDLKAVQGFASVATALFIPLAVQPGFYMP